MRQERIQGKSQGTDLSQTHQDVFRYARQKAKSIILNDANDASELMDSFILEVFHKKLDTLSKIDPFNYG